MSVHKTAMLLTTFAFFLPTAVADEPLGLVKDRPASGRFVETESGFMVPYEVRILRRSLWSYDRRLPNGSSSSRKLAHS